MTTSTAGAADSAGAPGRTARPATLAGQPAGTRPGGAPGHEPEPGPAPTLVAPAGAPAPARRTRPPGVPGGVPFRPLEPADLESSISARFRAVARMLPDTPALVSPGQSFTFAEADAQADQVAALLLAELGSGDEPVATLLPHSATGLVGLLAALRTGRPAVLLDTMLPTARIGQILRMSGAVGCLVDAATRPVADEAAAGGRVVDIAAAGRPATADANGTANGVMNGTANGAGAGAGANGTAGTGRTSAANGTAGVLGPGGTPFPGDLGGADTVAAIVFTSGSTGEPKGVVWTNGTLVNDAYAGTLALGFTPGDRSALVLPYSFAAGLTVAGFALLNGAGVYAYDPRSLGIRDLPEWVTANRLTTLHTTPSLLRSLVGGLAAGDVLSDLRLVTTCGEAVYGGDIASLRPHLPPAATYTNWSGSSEVASLAFFPIGPGDPIPDGTIPTGWPATGKDVTIEREAGTALPAGQTGNVVVTSHYLAAGYWGAPELTAGTFTPAPDGGLRCPTGDLGRFEADGRLVLLGRGDAAVKVRGYLVEPSEIESALLALPDISEAVVVAVRQPPEPHRLVAYVVARSGNATPAAAAIRRLLRARLPSYMVPATIMTLPELPRTERGKVDRAALPPPRTAPASSRVPRTQWEVLLADLWARVLELEAIGVDDDFTELGGDSLAAEELRALVREELGVHLPATAVIDAPTLAEFARKVSVADRSGPAHPTIVPLRAHGTRPPLFCVAGAAGLALGFVSLSRGLGEDQPVFGFQAHGLERRGLPDWTVERAARRHLQLLRVIQPYGPYFLAGHSMGGLIALEMAHLLEAAGEEVALLVLVDTYLPASLRIAWGSDERPADPTAASVGQAAGSGGVGLAVAREYQRRMRVRPRLRSLGRVLLPEQRRNLLTKDTLRRMAQLPLTGLLVLPGLDEFEAFFHYSRMLERFYRPRPWPGRTVVYRAMGNPDAPRAWSRYLTGDHEYHDVATEHFSVLREPHIGQVAEGIRAEMDTIIARRAAEGRTRR